MPDCYFLIKAETVILNRSSQNVLRKHSLFDKTKEIVSKEERRLLISFTTFKGLSFFMPGRGAEYNSIIC